MNTITAEELLQGLKTMPATERKRFFSMLGNFFFGDENASHEQVFGHLKDAEFTAQEAAEYLEVSIATFRRYVHDGKIKASGTLGRNRMYATRDLKIFKQSLSSVKRK